MSVSLVGCASTALPVNLQPPQDLPANWATSLADGRSMASLSDQARWWTAFDDPLMADLVERALSGNLGVQHAQATLRQARALRDVAAAALWPVLGLSASAQRARSAGQPAHNTLALGLDASWEADVFGSTRYGVRASEAELMASDADLGAIQVSLAAEVALNYINLRGLQARLRIAQGNLASQQETLQITQWRLQAGLVTSLESEQARAAAEQTGASLPPLQSSVEQTRHALSVLIGQVPTALASALNTSQAVPQANHGLALSLPADTIRQRPDVRSAEWLVSAAAARVSQADAARAPSFNLSGTLGVSALTTSALSQGASVISGIAASLALPLLDGGAMRAQVRAQQAAWDQARIDYRATVLNALLEVEDALVALRDGQLRLSSLERASQAADNAAQLARQRYSGGLVDFQTVLETQRTQLTTQDSVASARTTLSADHVQLYKALGGGWRADQTDTSQEADAGQPAATTTRTPTP